MSIQLVGASGECRAAQSSSCGQRLVLCIVKIGHGCANIVIHGADYWHPECSKKNLEHHYFKVKSYASNPQSGSSQITKPD